MQAPFTVTCEQFGDTAVVTLTGELDTTRCDELDETLAGALSDGCAHLILDTTELTFCDSMGLRSLLEFKERAQRAGGWLRLVGVRGVLKRLLEVTGVAFVIPIDPDVPTAMRARMAANGDGTHGP